MSGNSNHRQSNDDGANRDTAASQSGAQGSRANIEPAVFSTAIPVAVPKSRATTRPAARTSQREMGQRGGASTSKRPVPLAADLPAERDMLTRRCPTNAVTISQEMSPVMMGGDSWREPSRKGARQERQKSPSTTNYFELGHYFFGKDIS